MKQLNEYKTSETDFETITQEPDGTRIMRDWVSADFSRNLEQRLAACRDVLAMITNSPLNSDRVEQLAEITLTLTAPKQ